MTPLTLSAAYYSAGEGPYSNMHFAELASVTERCLRNQPTRTAVRLVYELDNHG
jgi:hypothetical protein